MSRKLVLFDVDGTLITKCRLHPGGAFSEGFLKVYGIDFEWKSGIRTGMTDKRIIIEILRERGFDERIIREKMTQMFAAMTRYVEENIKEDNSFHEMPHVRELLVELEKKGDILGLVTGGVEKIAKLKLKKLGLMGFFKVGGFGDSSENRSHLVLQAIKMADEKFKCKFDNKDVFVIGDTPRDVQCGKEARVKTIAMATCHDTLFELKKHNPDCAFADFSEWEKIVWAIHKD
jgi:phosphoglycolate phosphatase